ncbi:MAG: hypothetical protein GX876_04995 [Bacteroidales bacterium]|nr:hypothetical protein [Bacteroidales bacterium]
MGKKTGLAGGFIIILFLLIVSCEKDKALSEVILGKWEVISITQITYENNIKKVESTLYFDPDEMKYQFIDNGVGIFFNNENDILFSWTLTGNQLVISKLFTKDLVADVSVKGSSLICTYIENDKDISEISYEIILTAKRIK